MGQHPAPSPDAKRLTPAFRCWSHRPCCIPSRLVDSSELPEIDYLIPLEGIRDMVYRRIVGCFPLVCDARIDLGKSVGEVLVAAQELRVV